MPCLCVVVRGRHKKTVLAPPLWFVAGMGILRDLGRLGRVLQECQMVGQRLRLLPLHLRYMADRNLYVKRSVSLF